MVVYGIVCRRCCADELSAGELHSKRSLQWKDGGGEEGRKYEGRKVAGSLTPMHYLSPLYDKHFHVNSGPRGHYLHITW